MFQGSGRLQPTKDDRAAFLEAVQACSGKMTSEMEVFRRYLVVKDDPGAFPRLEKDLLFYMEVQKFKVGTHVFLWLQSKRIIRPLNVKHFNI